MTLNVHLADGRATDADLVAVGATIAGFHAASTVETDADSGGLAEVLDETLATLRTVGAPMGRLAELARFCGAALTGFGPELTYRAKAGASATATAICGRSTSFSAPISKPSTASSSTVLCASPTSATTSPS